jgi:short-subunit dehydrogenase
MMRDLKEKKVLITGAAQGIGNLMALAFAKEGASVILTDKNESLLKEATEKLKGQGYEVCFYKLDVTQHKAIESLREDINRSLGPIDILVNNAGIVYGGAFLDVPLEKHALTYGVNTMGLVAMTHYFLPDLISRKEAHLVNIASASGFVGLPFGSTYASSKWSVIGFSESVRLELAVLGHNHVKVTIVCPSYINTGMFDGIKAPLLTSMLEPHEIVKKIIEAVKRDRVMLLSPFMVKMIPFLNAFFPTRFVDGIAKRLGLTTSMIGWKGKGDGLES